MKKFAPYRGGGHVICYIRARGVRYTANFNTTISTNRDAIGPTGCTCCSKERRASPSAIARAYLEKRGDT